MKTGWAPGFPKRVFKRGVTGNPDPQVRLLETRRLEALTCARRWNHNTEE